MQRNITDISISTFERKNMDLRLSFCIQYQEILKLFILIINLFKYDDASDKQAQEGELRSKDEA